MRKPERDRPAGESMNDSLARRTDACWRRIGVWGRERPRCDELERVVHCRNCDVFINTARELFENRPDETHLLEPQGEPPAVGALSVVVFRLGAFWLALPTQMVEVVSERVPVHRLPHRHRKVLLGVISISGEIIPCLSLSLALGLRRQRSLRDNVAKGIFERFVVVRWGDLRFAFRVAEIRGIHRYDPEDLQPAGEDLPETVTPYVTGAFTARLDENRSVPCACLAPDVLFTDLKKALS